MNRPCPVCREGGHDSKGDHLFLLPTQDKFLCNRVEHHPDNQYYFAGVDAEGEPDHTTRGHKTNTSVLGDSPIVNPYDVEDTDEATPDVSQRQTVDVDSLPTVGMRGMPKEQYEKYGVKTILSQVDRSPLKYYYPLFTHDGAKLWKIRVLEPKDFFTSESVGKRPLQFMGQHLYRKQKQLLITEGQDDAIAADWIINENRTPDGQVLCVSVPNGANDKAFRDNVDFIRKFDRVILDPDGDEAGQLLVEKIVSLYPDILVMTKSEKDACDIIKADKKEEYITAFQKAEKYRPPSIVSVKSVSKLLATPLAMGLSYPWQNLTHTTYGAVPRQIISVGSGPGVGKSSVVRAIQQHFMFKHEIPVGIFSLEDSTEAALRYLVGYMMNTRIHLPGAVYDGDEAVRVANSLDNRAFFFDNRYFKGAWANIEQTMRFMYADGVHHFFIDPVSALAAHLDASQANTFINSIMIQMSQLIQELPIWIMLVNHLNNPTSGPGHDEGGRVLPSQFTGSKGQWRYSTDMWGFERNLLSEDVEIKNRMFIRNLKHRSDGCKTGRVDELNYVEETGRLEEPGAFHPVVSGVPDLPPDPIIVQSGGKVSVQTKKPAQTLGDLLG